MIGNKIVLIAASIAAIIASSMLLAPVIAEPSYTQVTSSTVSSGKSGIQQDAGSSVVYKVATNGNIPHVADSYINSVAVFGYAWTGTDNTFTAAVIHPSFKDTIQNPTGWHLHTGTLAVDTTNCPTTDSNGPTGKLGVKIATITDPIGSVSITGNSLTASLTESLTNVTPINFSPPAIAFQIEPTNGALCIAKP